MACEQIFGIIFDGTTEDSLEHLYSSCLTLCFNHHLNQTNSPDTFIFKKTKLLNISRDYQNFPDAKSFFLSVCLLLGMEMKKNNSIITHLFFVHSEDLVIRRKMLFDFLKLDEWLKNKSIFKLNSRHALGDYKEK